MLFLFQNQCLNFNNEWAFTRHKPKLLIPKAAFIIISPKTLYLNCETNHVFLRIAHLKGCELCNKGLI